MTSSKMKRLLRLKQLAEHAQADELRQQQGILDQAHSALISTDERLRRVDGGPQDSGAFQLSLAARYRSSLSERAAVERVAVAQAQAEVDDSREDLVVAWRERKLFEGAYERVREDEKEARKQEQSRSADEAALRAYARPKGAKG